ncbi:MAG: glycosyltransferase [Fibrobacter sp.]|nr:glycosyltransferase [Fibrobacter sp.]
MDIWASIITYNPDEERLRLNLNAVRPQVNRLLIVDNGSNNLKAVQDIAQEFKCELISNGKNVGIARALNQVAEYVFNQGDEWVLTLDQDSVCQNKLIVNYRPYLNWANVGMITCDIYDRNTGVVSNGIVERHLKYKRIDCGEYSIIPMAITSGCLMNVQVCKVVGGFDNQMFIDYVDFDYCLNLHCHGYKIINVHYTGLLHEIGHGKKIRIFGRDCILTNHTPIRHYYIARNTIYFIKKYWNCINKFSIISELLARVFVVPFFEKNSVRKLMGAIRGLRDGVKMKIDVD